jgi:hypothetical protein
MAGGLQRIKSINRMSAFTAVAPDIDPEQV